MTVLDIVTLAIMAVGAVAIIISSRRVALAVYFASVLLYPQEWSLDLAGLPMLFPAKVLAFPLVVSLFLRRPAACPFRVTGLDAAVVAVLAGMFVATLTHASPVKATADVSHDLALQVLTYFSIRLAITDRSDLLYLIKLLIVLATPLVIIGIFEAATGRYVYDELHTRLTGSGWETLALTIRDIEPRLGVYRPIASFGVHISLGLFFAGMAGLVFCLHGEDRWSLRRMVALALLMLMGVASTISTAPIYSVVISGIILLLYPLRRSAAFLLPLMVLILVYFQFLGPQWGVTTPLTDRLQSLSFVPENADYRVGLIEEAFGGGMHGHWLFGYGYGIGVGTEDANPEFNWEHDDIVNLHIAQLARFGLFGAIPLLVVTGLSFVYIARAVRDATDPRDAWLAWCVLAVFAGWQVAFLTVSAIFQMSVLIFSFIGVIGSLPQVVSGTEDAYDEVVGANRESRHVEALL